MKETSVRSSSYYDAEGPPHRISLISFPVLFRQRSNKKIGIFSKNQTHLSKILRSEITNSAESHS
ncbi:hypothetical protein LEP1GSC168_3744 [Leptospira santarosai str. HAI134]|uniref:Uncharacterized protein n=1 Tax=Leptospira santarosai serovar Shermani str. LT 821 TaxID=758847 RepID=A0A097ESK9_9LEPT|nr:hypothetical protein LSS_21825 [Leptospira santarosai serovar Shermani str. LT 821]EMO20388.1 hypothetical protein LEP1GSC168_3744 [Leptospira santarosai str. HAI134]